MFTLPNWIHKILKGHSCYSILSNLINEVRFTCLILYKHSKKLINKDKAPLSKHALPLFSRCKRKVEGGSSYREILGEALAPPGLSQLCLQMGAAASRQEEEQHLPAGNGCSHGAYSWPGVNPFKKNFRRKKSYPHPSLCFLRPQGLGGQVTELFLAYLHNESFPRCVLGDTNPQR